RARFLNIDAAKLRYDAYLAAPDLFTVDSPFKPQMPLHRFALDDAAGTKYYVSERTGETVMRTDTKTRVLGFTGYVLHRLTFMKKLTWWQPFWVFVEWFGLMMCLSGIVLGIWRFSPSARFRQKRVPSHTPYASWMKWHHYAGLIFGLITFTWMFSGAVTVHAIPGIGDSPMTKKQRESITGGSLSLKPLTIAGLQGAAAALATSFPVREVELLQFEGKPYFIGYRPPSAGEVAPWVTKSVTEFISPLIDHDHLLVSATAPEQGA